ncbi:MAG: DUF2330 domain-containing protein [Polyangia bacterium]
MRSLVLGTLLAASLTVGAHADAFCGFFVAGSNEKLTNNASQVAILREGRRIALTMSNTYQGPPQNFAMVVPVPVVLKKEDVKTLPLDVFAHIDALTAPRLVEYWEQDPCAPSDEEKDDSLGGLAAPTTAVPAKPKGGSHGVTIEAHFAIGEYEILVLSAKESNGLETWLREHGYTLPSGAAAALAPYVRSQMKFFVAKVDITKVKRDEHGTVKLSPLRMTYAADEVRLPVRLGLLNAEAKQDLVVYLLDPHSRFEVANYPNVFVPTNLEVLELVKKSFASFYAELFDATLAQKQGKAVVTEYAWQTSSCDPCPTPPLQPADLATLGASDKADGKQTVGPTWASWVVTRLHARYDRATLADDLVFRSASPIVGGRASYRGTQADTGAKPSAANNFQARYIVRNYWKGASSCAAPRWGRWGGPPGGIEPEPVAAQGLATAARGNISLRSVVRSAVPSLKLPGMATPKHQK